MKKSLVCLLLLTGCSANVLTNTCTKVDKANTLTKTTTYTITFEKDIVSNVKMEEVYQDEKKETLLSLFKSLSTQHMYWQNEPGLTISMQELEDSIVVLYDMEYFQIEDSFKTKFHLLESRSKMVQGLKEQGFTCK